MILTKKMKKYRALLIIAIAQLFFVVGETEAQTVSSSGTEIALVRKGQIPSEVPIQSNDTSMMEYLQSNYIISGVGVAVFLLIVVFISRILYSNRIISKQNKNFTIQQKKLEEAQQKLQKSFREEQKIREALEETHHNLKSAQSQLIHAEKMSSLGQLTAGIAHEINNPVSFIKGGVQTLKMAIQDLNSVVNQYEAIPTDDLSNAMEKLKEVKADSEEVMSEAKEMITQLFKDILYGTDRVTEIVNGLRTFSRYDEAKIKSVGLHENLESALLLLKHKYKSRAEIIKQYDPNVLNIDCLPGQLNQVFVNLISNAVDAMEEFGTLMLSTRDLGDKVQLSFKDNGKGIPDDVRDKIFDPFFTTKGVGEGTGLGLSISHSIIEQHKGTIEVFTGVGSGTEFTITLPKQLEIEEVVAA